MRCLETRTTSEGFKRRRYERDNKTRFSTLEIPESVAKAVGIKRLRDAMAKINRGQAAREQAAKHRQEVSKREGWKATAVAHDLNITEARVRQIRALIGKDQSERLT